MQSLIIWTVKLVIVCSIGAIILFLSPSSSLSKSVKTIVVLCVLVTFISPILKVDFEGLSDNSFSGESESFSDVTDKMLEYAELEAEELVDSFVRECDCQAKKIKALADINEENSIYISNIKIYISMDFKDSQQKINEKIRNVFDLDGEFIWEKE